ncbi:MAG: class I SAM-dependent methyltransferase [Acidobacteria bacterium]|nr:class I SAM-dependent methyltransferase [Acidobacteriota bacterium]
MKFFGKGEDQKEKNSDTGRMTRHSSGWEHALKFLKSGENLRILDFGHTSPANINFVTGLGHSIYMADLVEPSRDSRWKEQIDLFTEDAFDVKAFLEENLRIADRHFDLVLLWDTIDYLPQPLANALLARLHDIMTPDAKLLALFHIKHETGAYRYHMRQDAQVDMQLIGEYSLNSTYTARQIEELFSHFSGTRFFLAKDNLREVLVTR